MNAYEIEYVIGTSYTVIIEAESESMARNAFEEEYAASNGMLDEAEEGEVTHDITDIREVPSEVEVEVVGTMTRTYDFRLSFTVSREEFKKIEDGDYSCIDEYDLLSNRDEDDFDQTDQDCYIEDVYKA